MAKIINGITPDTRRAILANMSTVTEALLALTGITDTMTFYAASTSGGTCDVLNILTIESGRITEWLQSGPSGTPGEWQFNDTVNSGQILTIGF